MQRYRLYYGARSGMIVPGRALFVLDRNRCDYEYA